MVIQIPENLEELLNGKKRRPVNAILKRGETDKTVPFDMDKIKKAVSKASKASGREYSKESIEDFAEEVRRKLESKDKFISSGRAIPHVEDVQDAVLEVFDERNARNFTEYICQMVGADYSKFYPIILDCVKGLDPTGDFYERYKKERDAVREKLVHLPFTISLDSTDKQLRIQDVYKKEANVFDADVIKNLILERHGRRTNVTYDDAQSAVKRVQEFLAKRTVTGSILPNEIVAIIDAALMERGYKQDDLLSGRQINLTLDDVIQIIFQKSVENSNIQLNNPEAVNLAIAETALKELALRDVFEEDVAQAHRDGLIHLHNLGYVDRVYCSAHSVDYVKKYGLDVIVGNLDSKSKPATKPIVLNNHINTLFASIQAVYAGALGLPMLNLLYGPMMLKEIEMVEGYETVRDENGSVIGKVKKRMDRKTLDDYIESGNARAEDFEITKTRKILRKRDKAEMKEVAQNLGFSASQNAFSRGGQTLFIDYNINIDTPEHLINVPAMFAKGTYITGFMNEYGELEIIERTTKEPERYHGLTIDRGHGPEPSPRNGDVIQPEDGKTVRLTYGHELVEDAAMDFADALFDVFAEGDKYGNPFNFPKCDVHVSKRTFEKERSKELLKKACKLTEINDSTYFMLDRGDGMNIAQCCRLRERITDPELLKRPEKLRFCGFQNVTINLAQTGFRASKKAESDSSLEEKISSTYEEIDSAMLMVLKAHANKRRFIQELLDTPGSPLYMMGRPSDDGEPYLDLNKATYIIGFIGLNELVQHLTGEEMHESPKAMMTGLKIVSHMNSMKNRFAEKYGMKIVIEESPAESTSRRLAKIDLLKYPEYAKKVLKGSIEEDTVYYTNSCHLRPDAPVDGLDRAILQSKFNPMIEAGAITHVFTGEKQNKADAVYDFVHAIYHHTQSSQIVFSGEHTVCMKCGHHHRGLVDKCPECGNDDASRLSQKTRIVGYFSDPRKWNKSKKGGELKDRQKAQGYYAGEKDSAKDLESELLQYILEPGKIRIAVAGKPDCEICTKTEAMIRKYVEKKVPEELRGRVEIVKYNVNDENDRVYASIYNAPIDSYPTVIVHQGNRYESTISEYPYNGKAVVPTTGDIDRMFKQITGIQEVPKETAAVT